MTKYYTKYETMTNGNMLATTYEMIGSAMNIISQEEIKICHWWGMALW
jgi:hypothetical protein